MAFETLRLQTKVAAPTNLLPVAAVLGSITSLTIGSSFAKHLFPIVGAQGTTALRLGLAAVLLCAVWRPWRRPLARSDLAKVALYGVVLGTMNLLFYMALRTIPIGIAIAIEFVGPLTVAVASSRRAVDFVWIGCAALGLALLLPFGVTTQPLDPVGFVYVLGAAACWGAYIIVGQRAGRLPGRQAVSLGMVAASLVVVPVGAIHAGIAHTGAAFLDWRVLGLGAVVAVLSSAIPYSLEMVALQRLPKQTFGILLSLEPAFGALAAFVILGEQLGILQVLAIAAIIAASVGSTLTARRRRRTPLPCEG